MQNFKRSWLSSDHPQQHLIPMLSIGHCTWQKKNLPSHGQSWTDRHKVLWKEFDVTDLTRPKNTSQTYHKDTCTLPTRQGRPSSFIICLHWKKKKITTQKTKKQCPVFTLLQSFLIQPFHWSKTPLDLSLHLLHHELKKKCMKMHSK